MRWLMLMAMAGALMGAEWKAGVAKVEITPEGPIWMAGYAARKHPSEGVVAPLYAKALAIDDGGKGRVVFVTTDIIGYPRSVSEEIAVKVLKQYGLERGQLVLNASHTHSGPVVWPNLSEMYPLNGEQRERVEAFTRRLVGQVVELVGVALGKMGKARVEQDQSVATFAMHRRKQTPEGIKLAPNPEGPKDHLVPVIKVRDGKGKLRAVMFGYSCHNTTMTGEFYQLNGDYAGFAQAEIEARRPGVMALFATGCAGDQNPEPRSSFELAERHGKALGEAVVAVLERKGEELKGKIEGRYQVIELPFAPFGQNDFEKELGSANAYARRRAEVMLKAMAERRISHQLSYPIQAVRLGQARVVTLGGEVVVDYCLRLRRETGNPKLFVMAYSNDVMCYIPTRKQVEEGGYEARDSFIYYGQPAGLAGEAEDILIEKVKALLKGMN